MTVLIFCKEPKEKASMSKIKVCIIGAGGYGGCGAIELILGHPDAEITAPVPLRESARMSLQLALARYGA